MLPAPPPHSAGTAGHIAYMVQGPLQEDKWTWLPCSSVLAQEGPSKLGGSAEVSAQVDLTVEGGRSGKGAGIA